MSFKGLHPTDYEERVDFVALRKERLQKAREAMAKSGVDALLLSKSTNSRYVTGARSLDVMSRGPGLPSAVITQGADAPYVWSSRQGDVPAWVPRDHIYPMTWHPVKHIQQIVNILGTAVKGRLAVDSVAPYFVSSLNALVPGVRLVNANEVMDEVRKVKTANEVECIRIAHMITEAAMHRVIPHLKPGARDIDLHGKFLEETGKLGANFPISAGVYLAQPKHQAEAPWAGERPPYKQLGRDTLYGEGDIVTIETGTFYQGYVGLFGRTWYCSYDRQPSAAEKDLYKRWRETYEKVAAQCKPGNTAAQIHEAAPEAVDSAPRYLVHGVGMGLEPPVVARGLNTELEKKWTLEPGMLLTIAPYIWKEGVGGFRASETILITEKGNERVSSFPHGPLAD